MDTTNCAYTKVPLRLFVGAPRKEKKKPKYHTTWGYRCQEQKRERQSGKGREMRKDEKDGCNTANSLFFVEYRRGIVKKERERDKEKEKEKEPEGEDIPKSEEVPDLYSSVEHKKHDFEGLKDKVDAKGGASEWVPVLLPSVDRKQCNILQGKVGKVSKTKWRRLYLHVYIFHLCGRGYGWVWMSVGAKI